MTNLYILRLKLFVNQSTLKKVKRQVTNKRKIFAIYSTDRGIVLNIYKEPRRKPMWQDVQNRLEIRKM